jgi:hypothetical protein
VIAEDDLLFDPEKYPFHDDLQYVHSCLG